EGINSGGRFRIGTAEEGFGQRNDYVAPQRLDQDCVGADNDGRSHTRNRALEEGVEDVEYFVKRTAEEDDRNGRERPALVNEQRAPHPRERESAAAGHAAAVCGGHQGSCL